MLCSGGLSAMNIVNINYCHVSANREYISNFAAADILICFLESFSVIGCLIALSPSSSRTV